MVDHRTKQRPKVLVADDDEMLRIMAKEALSESFDILEAANGRDAVAVFEEHEPEIVVLDVVMPELDGFDACAEIRRHPRGVLTPILMVTGSDDIESIHRAYGVGATDFATKPINYLVLAHRLYYLLRSRETLGELRRTERRLTRVQKTARLGAWEFDVPSESLRLYDATVEILGMESGGWGNASLEELFTNVHADDRAKLENLVERARVEREPFNLLHRVQVEHEEARWIYHDVDVVDIDGRAVLTGVAQDVTERRQSEQKIYQLAYYDELTGLPNRNYLSEHLDYLLETSNNEGCQVTLLSLDLDFFKRVNDSLGHKAGDAFLRETAGRLGSLLNEHTPEPDATGVPSLGKSWNLVARRGDDEFVVVVPTVGKDSALQFAERVRLALAAPATISSQDVVLTSSIGIATYPAHGATPSEVLKNAQTAMNEAKRRGRNRCITFSPDMDTEALRRLSLDSALRQALDKEQFRLHFQPKVNVQDGSVSGVEALLRWKHPELGTVGPGEFLPIAEETGLIVPLGEWVLRTACAQLSEWRALGFEDLTMSVNISARQFEQPGLTDMVAEALRSNRLPASTLELEVTEGILLKDDVNARSILIELESLGVGIALDDFGTGYSSLSYLKRFPIHTVKIDRSFVSDVTENSDSAAIVRAIIALADGLHLKVVAEGVETREQMDFLAERSCIQHQGYFFSRPLPPEEFLAWVRLRDAALREPARATSQPLMFSAS